MDKEKKFVIKKSHHNPFKRLARLLLRYHLLIFFIIMITGATLVVILINRTLTETANQQFTPTINADTIDQATLERIQSLHTSNEPGVPPVIPSGRINPFSE